MPKSSKGPVKELSKVFKVSGNAIGQFGYEILLANLLAVFGLRVSWPCMVRFL